MHVCLPESMVLSCTICPVTPADGDGQSRCLGQKTRTRPTSEVTFPSHPLSLQQASQGLPGREMSLKILSRTLPSELCPTAFSTHAFTKPYSRKFENIRYVLHDGYFSPIILDRSIPRYSIKVNWQAFYSHFMSVFPVFWPFSPFKITLFYNYFKEVKAPRRTQLRKAI